MTKKLTIILFVFVSHTFSQNNTNVITQDFNNDNVIDTLKTYYEGGGSFGGKFGEIINGKTNQVFLLDNYGCYCEIKSIISIPPELNKTKNLPFLKALKKVILPPKRARPDASLDWIIRSSCANKKLNNNPFFDLIVDPKIQWKKNKLEIPDTYRIDSNENNLSQLHCITKNNKGDNNKKSVLVYFSHNHYRQEAEHGLKLIDSSSHYKIFKTAHGVLAKKGDLNKWLFISDFDITGAPEKLRWQSIKQTKLLDNYLLLLQDMPPGIVKKLFAINIETGICGRLKFDFLSSSSQVFDNDNTASLSSNWESFIHNINEKEYNYKMEDVLKELESLYLTKNNK